MKLVRPYAMYAFRYPPFLAPDNHFRFPLRLPRDAYTDHSVETPHGFYPVYRDPPLLRHAFDHCGVRGGGGVALVEPPIGLAARLVYVALMEHQHMVYPGAELLYADREEALAHGAGVEPTLADYREFAALRAACAEWGAGAGAGTTSTSTSVRWEDDWARWRGCGDPWDPAPPAVRPKYTVGALTGLWGGCLLVSVPLFVHACTHAWM